MKKHLGKIITGFTLAEVLVTLVIVGVIAGLTIPALVQNIQDAQYKTAYKKSYSDISNALKQCITNNELSSCAGKWDTPCHLANFNAMRAKFQVVTQCADTAHRSPCWADGENFWSMPDTRYTDFTYFVDNMGRTWADASSEAWIFVDTNGLKGPNIDGKDRFMFVPVSDNTYSYNSAGNYTSLVGIPDKIALERDFISSDSNMCPSGNCLYTSWLQQ